jgi:hypothetical protein
MMQHMMNCANLYSSFRDTLQGSVLNPEATNRREAANSLLKMIEPSLELENEINTYKNRISQLEISMQTVNGLKQKNEIRYRLTMKTMIKTQSNLCYFSKIKIPVLKKKLV